MADIDIASLLPELTALRGHDIGVSDWKLIDHINETTFEKRYNGRYTGRPGNQKGAPELYNLAKDPTEKKNLATGHPEKVADLRKALDAWWKPGK